MRGKATVAVPWARPEDAEGVLQRLAWLGQPFEGPSTHGTRIICPCEYELDDRPLIRQRAWLALLGKGTGGQIPLRIEAVLFQEIRGQQSRLGRAATPEGHTLPLQVWQGGDARVAPGEQLGADVDVDITHRHDATGIVQALFDVDI